MNTFDIFTQIEDTEWFEIMEALTEIANEDWGDELFFNPDAEI